MNAITKDRPSRADSAIAELSNYEATIVALEAKYHGLAPDTPERYELTRLAIGEMRGLRGDIERRKKELNADALTWQRRVNEIAKNLTAAIVAVEDPLKAAKQLVDDAKEAEKRAAELARQQALEAEILAKRQAEEAAAKAVRQAEEDRLRTEALRLNEQREQQAKERAAWLKERAVEKAKAAREAAEAQAKVNEANRIAREAQQAAQAKIDAERAELDAQRCRLEQEEAARQAKAQAEADAADRAERERREAEEAAAAKAAAEKAERERLGAIQPDLKKLRVYLKKLREISSPEFSHEDEELTDILFDVDYAIGVAIIKAKEIGNTEDSCTDR